MKHIIAAAIIYLIGPTFTVKRLGVMTLGSNQFVEILVAAYGPADFTEKVRALYDRDVKTV